MKGILVRIAADHSYGRWNGPVDPDTGRFVYAPIWDDEPKKKPYKRGMGRRFTELQPALTRFNAACRLAHESKVRLPKELSKRWMHLDPDFEHLTYGDRGDKRGAGIRCLLPGDFLAFYAGLKPVRPSEHKLLYALVGFFVVDKIMYAADSPKSDRHRNAHTRWRSTSANDIVVFARHSVSGRLERCVPIGEWRRRAYRVRKSLLNRWGGLTVKNGYLQRSAVPPSFREADRFYSWFVSQKVRLLPRNN